MKAFIIGYYGSDNIGDEVLLHQVIRIIGEIDPRAEISSLSYRTSRTQALHGIQGVGRNKYWSILKAIWKADIVVGGGGSMLQNVTSNRSLFYYLMLIRMAKLMGKRVILMGNGFGPVNGSFYRNLTRRILNQIDAFVARDTETVNRLRDMGVRSRIEEAADLAYYGYESHQGESSRKVVINLRPWKQDERIAEATAEFAREAISKGYELSFLSMQPGRDDQMLRKLEDHLGTSISLMENTVEAFLHAKEEIHCLVGMRLHALIWAGIKDVPTIGISYDPKIDAYFSQTGQILAGSADEVTGKGMIESFNLLESDYDGFKKKLAEANQRIAEKASVNKNVLENIWKEIKQ